MLTLYHLEASPPSRAVRLCLKSLNLPVELEVVDLLKKEHYQPDFLALNPEHKIPVLVDDDFVLNESRAIISYLADKYDKENAFYPKDVKTRALVNKMLYFDMGTLYQQFFQYLIPCAFGYTAEVDKSRIPFIHEALKHLNNYLDGHDYAVGNSITIADFSLVATVSSMVAAGLALTRYPEIEKWMKRCEENMNGYGEVNAPGAEQLSKFFQLKLGPIQWEL